MSGRYLVLWGCCPICLDQRLKDVQTDEDGAIVADILHASATQ